MKMGSLYDIIDAPIIMADNDGKEYTISECKLMDVISIQVCVESILCIVDKFTLLN